MELYKNCGSAEAPMDKILEPQIQRFNVHLAAIGLCIEVVARKYFFSEAIRALDMCRFLCYSGFGKR